MGRVADVRVIQQNKTLLGLKFTTQCKPPDEIHACELGTSVWPGRGSCCESVSDDRWERVIPAPASLCVPCLCPATDFMVVRSITSTGINSLGFKLKTK